MARWFTKNAKMIGVGRQTDISTANAWAISASDYHVFAAEIEVVEGQYQAAEWAAARAQGGAKMAPVPGRRGATFSLRMPLQALKTGSYVLATDGPGAANLSLSPQALLLANALGSAAGAPTALQFLQGSHLSASAYIAPGGTGVVGATTTVITAPSPGTDATFLGGQFAACAASNTDTTPQFGWVKSQVDGGATNDITLYEASQQTAAAGDSLMGTATAYMSSNQQIPLTFRVFGPNSAGTELLTGCYCVGGEIDLKFGDEPWVKLDFIAADFSRVTGASQIVPATGTWYICPTAKSANNGRFTYGASGTGSASSVQGWKDLKIVWKTPIERIESAAGIQGWGTPGLSFPDVTVTASIAYDSADTIGAGGDHTLVDDFVAGNKVSICWSSGIVAGRIVSVFLPSLHHNKCPVPKGSGEAGMLYHEIELVPDEYIGDTTGARASTAVNSLFRIGYA